MSDKNDLKSRIKKATEGYIKKTTTIKQKRHNKSPEKDLQQDVVKWLRSIGWDVSVVESKSTFSLKQGRYIGQAAAPGFCDIVGNDPEGRAVFIEMKAPGRRNTLRDNQREFLIRKINSGCYAVVADSQLYIHQTYHQWLHTNDKPKYLLSLLPDEKPIDSSPLFEDE